jgi:holo-[acyl-carrier protein] synthase
VGVDLVAVSAFQSRFEGRDEVLDGVFTGTELDYCRSQRRPWPHLAARFAAKEAALKALGTGLAGAMTWRDVEVVRDEAGTPALAVSGATAARMAAGGLRPGALSLAHAGDQAIAVVLLFPREPGPPAREPA